MSDKLPPKKPVNNYMKYSSMGIQMLVTIFLGVFGGRYLDKYFEFKTPIFTLVLSLLSVVVAIYMAIKDFLKK